MSFPLPHVMVIDDDASVRRSVLRLLETEGYAVATFSSAASYLESPAPSSAACVVLDVQMPGMSGVELQQALAERGLGEQIIFVTGHGDVPMCAEAMKNGAVDFLQKPFTEDALLKAVARAIQRATDWQATKVNRERNEVVRKQALASLAKLTPREMEVFRWVISGLLNKQIGAELGTSEKTIKIQRGSITTKLGITAVADMVRLAQQAGIEPARKSELA
ncbi:response regulator transcription factor [Luteolibacter soli]|uniref:Response regulator n=1 Tax=Luteolibacter soli TaxID=3135280 RepID=A0ABU9ANC1_9BACT